MYNKFFFLGAESYSDIKKDQFCLFSFFFLVCVFIFYFYFYFCVCCVTPFVFVIRNYCVIISYKSYLL